MRCSSPARSMRSICASRGRSACGRRMIVPLRRGDAPLGALTLVSAESGRRYSERPTSRSRRSWRVARRSPSSTRGCIVRRWPRARDAERVGARRRPAVLADGAADRRRDAEAVADAVLAEAADAFGAERGTVSLIEDDGDTTRSLAAFGYARGRAARVAIVLAPTDRRRIARRGRDRTRRVHRVARRRARALPGHRAVLRARGTETAVVLPIVTDGRARAVITLSWTDGPRVRARRRASSWSCSRRNAARRSRARCVRRGADRARADGTAAADHGGAGRREQRRARSRRSSCPTCATVRRERGVAIFASRTGRGRTSRARDDGRERRRPIEPRAFRSDSR